MIPDWIQLPKTDVQSVASGDPYWESRLSTVKSGVKPAFDFHLAVMVEPYLGFVLDGAKTVESRFSVRRTPPYQKVKPGDVIFLKRSSGPILGICEIAAVWFYRLDPTSWEEIRREFTKALCAQDPGFWHKRKNAVFATLMRIQNVIRIPPIKCEKRDRRGWVVLTSNHHRLPLEML